MLCRGNGQVYEIRRLLRLKNLGQVRVGTVDDFQARGPSLPHPGWAGLGRNNPCTDDCR